MPVGKSNSCHKKKAVPAPAKEQRASDTTGADDNAADQHKQKEEVEELPVNNNNIIADPDFCSLLVVRHRHASALRRAAA